MMAAIGKYILDFFLGKIWGLVYQGLIVLFDYFTDLLIRFRRDKKLDENKTKLADAIKTGDKDKIAKAGQDALNND